MVVLGIDTSCDDTSCALVVDGNRVLSNVISSQYDLHARFGGVVPEIASRRHLEVMVPATCEALSKAGLTLGDIDAIAVTAGPGLLGSLLVGVCFAKSLAFGLKKKLVGVHHIEGHIFANFLGIDPPPFPLLNLVVSGGHSDLVLMKDYGDYELLGQTRDDAAGEAFDKVARELGLPYPGGPFLDDLADQGDPDAFSFPHPKIEGGRFDYSFSGLKTRALQTLAAYGPEDKVKKDLAASFRKAVVSQLLQHIPQAARETNARAFALSGGVAANKLLRREAEALCREIGIPLYVPSREYCTDNGAMIAAAGFRRLLAGQEDGPSLNAQAGLELTSWRTGSQRLG